MNPHAHPTSESAPSKRRGTRELTAPQFAGHRLRLPLFAALAVFLLAGCAGQQYQTLDLQPRQGVIVATSEGRGSLVVVQAPEYTEGTMEQGGRVLVPVLPGFMLERQGSFSAWLTSGVHGALQEAGIDAPVVSEAPIDGTAYVTLRLEDILLYVSDLQIMFENGAITGHCDLTIRVSVMQDDQVLAYAVVAASGESPSRNAWELPVGEATSAAARQALADASRQAAQYISKNVGAAR